MIAKCFECGIVKRGCKPAGCYARKAHHGKPICRACVSVEKNIVRIVDGLKNFSSKEFNDLFIKRNC